MSGQQNTRKHDAVGWRDLMDRDYYSCHGEDVSSEDVMVKMSGNAKERRETYKRLSDSIYNQTSNTTLYCCGVFFLRIVWVYLSDFICIQACTPECVCVCVCVCMCVCFLQLAHRSSVARQRAVLGARCSACAGWRRRRRRRRRKGGGVPPVSLCVLIEVFLPLNPPCLSSPMLVRGGRRRGGRGQWTWQGVLMGGFHIGLCCRWHDARL